MNICKNLIPKCKSVFVEDQIYHAEPILAQADITPDRYYHRLI